MTRAMPILMLTITTIGCAPNVSISRDVTETRLLAALRGKVAGSPLACVSTRNLTNSHRIGGDRLLFETRGSLVYVNDTVGGCSSLTKGRALSISTRAGRLCDGDVVRVFDRLDGSNAGSCALSTFVPYRLGPNLR